MKFSMLLRASIVVGAALAFAAATGAPSSADSLSNIRTRGTLNVGVKADVIGFAYLNPKTEHYEGYEIDIAH
jgi:ABC-type amino acid transport substrate-binding protein